MSKYVFDRGFTDFVHQSIALNKIYSKLGWKIQDINDKLLENVDLRNGVDYFFVDSNYCIVTTQERFRESKYSDFNDFTIRYERPHSEELERKRSEYFKLNADYFVYGITNGSKYKLSSNTDFVKFAVIDIKKLKMLIKQEKIIITDQNIGYKCKIIDGKIYCPINKNKDRSSTFVPIDIKLLKELFGNENLILLQKGF